MVIEWKTNVFISIKLKEHSNSKMEEPEVKKITTRKPKTLFTHEEDDKLRMLVETKGTHAWNEIQCCMPGRTARQCRERWNLYLSPNVDNTPWSQEEEINLIKTYQITGPRWSLISKSFPNRTPNNIKNHIKQCIRRSNKVLKNECFFPIIAKQEIPQENISQVPQNQQQQTN